MLAHARDIFADDVTVIFCHFLCRSFAYHYSWL